MSTYTDDCGYENIPFAYFVVPAGRFLTEKMENAASM